MKLIQILKEGKQEAVDNMIYRYKNYIYYEMHQYNIINREECYDCVIERMLWALYKFQLEHKEIEKRFRK